MPVLAGVRPIGEHLIEEFEAAGGCRALMKQLLPLLDPAALTVTGRTVAHNLADVPVADAEVIRPIDRPVRAAPGHHRCCAATSRPNGSLIKTGIAERKVRRFTGPADLLRHLDAAVAALQRQAASRPAR